MILQRRIFTVIDSDLAVKAKMYVIADFDVIASDVIAMHHLYQGMFATQYLRIEMSESYK